MRSAEARAVLATASRESTVALLAAANYSGIEGLADSPEMKVIWIDSGHSITEKIGNLCAATKLFSVILWSWRCRTMVVRTCARRKWCLLMVRGCGADESGS